MNRSFALVALLAVVPVLPTEMLRESGTVFVAPTPARSDTILDLRRGDRVVLDNLAGEISVAAWNREQLEVRSDEGESGLVVRRAGSVVRITRDDRKGRRRAVEASIRVPEWIDLEASGRSLELWVDGIGGSVDISNVSGDIWVRNSRGPVNVRTVQGEIDVSNAMGGVNASSQSDEVRLRAVQGPVSVHSGSGDVQLIDIESETVRAETQDGDIEFSGTIVPGGDYRFFVHDGDANIAIPSDVSARVAVSTFDGEFESVFPVIIERFTGGREFDFVLGDGRARIEIQVFDGEINLLRRR